VRYFFVVPMVCCTIHAELDNCNAKDSLAKTSEIKQNGKVEVRLRAGCVVLRRGRTGGYSNEANRVGSTVPEVLLVSRRNVSDSYTVPAGKYEDDADGNSFEACAMRETREEAGVEGDLILDLGWYHGQSKKASHKTCTRFFVMRCLNELTAWDEASERTRSWYDLNEAQRLVEHNPSLVDIIRKAGIAIQSGVTQL